MKTAETLCHEHGLLRESCGPCHQQEIEDALTPADAAEALAMFFREKLVGA